MKRLISILFLALALRADQSDCLNSIRYEPAHAFGMSSEGYWQPDGTVRLDSHWTSVVPLARVVCTSGYIDGGLTSHTVSSNTYRDTRACGVTIVRGICMGDKQVWSRVEGYFADGRLYGVTYAVAEYSH